MTSFWIVADDLSGAADAGVAFVAHGHDVRVVLDNWGDTRGSVAVVDVDTRDHDVDRAATAVRRVLVDVPRGARLLKKIDSTLRGHVAAELAALREVLPTRLLVVAPAFPAAGRTTRNGVQHVHGVPLHLSDLWPAEAADAPQSVAEALAPLPVREIAIAAPKALTHALEAAAAAGCVAVCDAGDDADLDAVVAAADGLDVVWAGSAGLAAALARGYPGRRRATQWTCDGARYLAVVGSATPVAARQAAELRAAGAALVELPRDTLERSDPTDLERLRTDLAARARDRSIVVTIAGAPATSSADAVRRALAAVVAPAAAGVPVLALVGGATGRVLLEELGIRALDLVAEPEPGVAVARAGGRHVVTKAGAFGDDGTLVRVLHERSAA